MVSLWILMIEIRRTSRHWYGLGGPYLWLNPQALTRWSGGARGESFQRMTLAKAVSSEKHVINHYYLLSRSNKSFILLLGYGLHSLGIPFELSYSFAPLHLFDGSKDLWFYVILFFSFFLSLLINCNQKQINWILSCNNPGRRRWWSQVFWWWWWDLSSFWWLSRKNSLAGSVAKLNKGSSPSLSWAWPSSATACLWPFPPTDRSVTLRVCV